MTDSFPERPNSIRAKLMIVILLFIVGLYMGIVLGLFEESEEPEGIFVRFILFFKQSILLY